MKVVNSRRASNNQLSNNRSSKMKNNFKIVKKYQDGRAPRVLTEIESNHISFLLSYLINIKTTLKNKKNIELKMDPLHMYDTYPISSKFFLKETVDESLSIVQEIHDYILDQEDKLDLQSKTSTKL